jgi:hypothetical protein
MQAKFGVRHHIAACDRSQRAMGVGIGLVAALLGSLGEAVPAPPSCEQPAIVIARVSAAQGASAEVVPDGILVRLRGADGSVLAERTLPLAGSCDELGEAALALVATWQRTLSPTVLPPPRLPARRSRAVELEIGAAFSATFAGGDFAPGGTLSVLVGPDRGRVRARIALWGASPHEARLGSGLVRYGRAFVAAGPAVTFRPSRLVIDLRVEGALALLVLEGRGFNEGTRVYDADPALGGGARLAVRLGRVLPFVEVSAYGLLRRQRAFVAGVNDFLTLPRSETLLSIGIAAQALP